jgi:hypothetical protein
MALDRVSPPPPAVQPDPRDAELAELRRLLGAKDLAGAVLDRLLWQAVRIADLESERDTNRRRIASLERDLASCMGASRSTLEGEQRRHREQLAADRAAVHGRVPDSDTTASALRIERRRAEGCTWPQIAEEEDCSPGAARSRLARLLERRRQQG